MRSVANRIWRSNDVELMRQFRAASVPAIAREALAAFIAHVFMPLASWPVGISGLCQGRLNQAPGSDGGSDQKPFHDAPNEILIFLLGWSVNLPM